MKKIILVITSFISMAVFTGCDLNSSYDEVSVVIEDTVPDWVCRFPAITYRIEYPDINGNRKTEWLESGKTDAVIRLAKKTNQPIIAIPFADGNQLKPAGGFYPQNLVSTSDQQLSLSWENGFAARLLLDCFEKGFNPGSFNVDRFIKEISGRSGGDPWNLDYVKIAEKITSRDFRVTCMTRLPIKDLYLEPAEGTWFFESPFSQSFSSNGSGSVCFPGIPYGFHILFHLESRARYEVFLGEKETCAVYYPE